MSRRQAAAALAVGLLAFAAHAEIGEDRFLADSTEDLIVLCEAPKGDPMHDAAIGFCYGFLIGAYTAHVTEHAGPDGTPVVCLPDPQPTRSEGVQQYVAWARAHPEYAQERPVESLFKFLSETWPCPARAAAKENPS